MRFGTWDLVFNLLIFLFWFRVWNADDREVVFNPHLSPLGRFADAAVDFLRPVFFGLEGRLIALIALLFLIVLRAAAVPDRALWSLTLGVERHVDTASIPSAILFSLLSFAVFLFKLWGLSLIYVRGPDGVGVDRTAAALHRLAKPFTDIRLELRPWCLLAAGMALVALIDRAGFPAPVRPRASPSLPVILHWQSGIPALAARLALLSLAGWVSVLSVLQSFMILLIIGSWAAMFTGSPGIMLFCREWMDLILGPLRRYPLRLGMFDLSPILFFIGLMVVQNVLFNILMTAFRALS